MSIIMPCDPFCRPHCWPLYEPPNYCDPLTLMSSPISLCQPLLDSSEFPVFDPWEEFTKSIKSLKDEIEDLKKKIGNA